MEVSQANRECETVIDRLGEAVISDRRFFENVLVGVIGRGHVLLEDVPGTGKTLTARTIASVLGLSFSRIQFTPDLLPADVTGTHVFDESQREFEFNEGPIFANIVLADEINRAPPKTQSALLEAMEERQVTTDGETRSLPDPFFVIATQNPVEQEGTFGLPEAQIDRFAVKVSMGYPNFDGEVELLHRRADRNARSPTVNSLLGDDDVSALQQVPETVRVDNDIIEYMIRICRATRDDSRVAIGVSPRGTQRLFELSRTRAVLDGREYVTPDHVKSIAESVLAHRLVLTADARINDVAKSAVIETVLDSTDVPTID